MGSINCPFDAITLKIASLSMASKVEAYIAKVGDEQSQKDIEEVGTAMLSINDNQACADHHKISVDTLVNSPNYDKLKTEFQELCVRRTINSLKEKLDLTDKEAWALVLVNELGMLT